MTDNNEAERVAKQIMRSLSHQTIECTSMGCLGHVLPMRQHDIAVIVRAAITARVAEATERCLKISTLKLEPSERDAIMDFITGEQTGELAEAKAREA